MKNKSIVIFVVCILIITAFLLIFAKFKNKSNFNNLSIYKRNNFSEEFNDSNKINISEEQKTTIINYLNKEKFDRISNECSITGIYTVKYDNIEISFDNDSCGAYYKNTHTEENYNTNLSEEFKNYIINIID